MHEKNQNDPGSRRRVASSLIGLAALWIFTGCAHQAKVFRSPPVPPEPSALAPALPVPPEIEAETASPLPDNWQELAQQLTLADVVNIGLSNNTQTRKTWLAARAAAAQVGIQRASYLPTIDLDASLTHVQQSAVGGRFSFSQDVYGAAGTLNLLLFDFGGRAAKLDEAWAVLLASAYSHNAAIQDVVLLLQEAYYGYLATKAQLSAAQANVGEARVNLEAARKRHEVGVATVADVLRARTALSEAQLLEQILAGQIETLRGELATAMGIPASTSLELGVLPLEIDAQEITREVEPLIEQALANRPDLAAARWQSEGARSRVRSVQAQAWPSLSATSSANRGYYLPGAFEKHDNNWSASLVMSFPLFTGFAQTHEKKKAEAEAEVTQTEVTRVEQQVILEVWASYADLKTACQRMKTTRDFLASAEESEKVALAQYKQGVGSILDLLTAQAVLSSARAQEIHARSDWFLAMARLARATGSLAPPPGRIDTQSLVTSGEPQR